MARNTDHTSSLTARSDSAITDGHRDLAGDERASLESDLSGLRQRLVTLPVIEQSKGLLMGHYGIDADAAFAVLVRWSSHSNTKLRTISQELVASVSNLGPGESTHEALQQAIQRIQAPQPTQMTPNLDGQAPVVSPPPPA